MFSSPTQRNSQISRDPWLVRNVTANPTRYWNLLNGRRHYDSLENLRHLVLPHSLHKHAIHLSNYMRNLSATRQKFVLVNLATCLHVSSHVGSIRIPLKPPYKGPLPVVVHHDKTFKVDRLGHFDAANFDHFKVAYAEDSAFPNSTRFDVNLAWLLTIPPFHTKAWNYLCLPRNLRRVSSCSEG